MGPAWIVWIVVQSLPLVGGRPFLWYLAQTATFRGDSGQVFPITYAIAVGLFVFALLVLRPLNPARRILVSAAFPFAFTHLYEVPYDLIGRVAWPSEYAWATWPVVLVLNATWLALGLSTAIYWKVDRAGLAGIGATLVTFAAWWTWYWPPIGSVQLPINPEGSGYILSKALLAVTLATLLWTGRRLADPGRDGVGSRRLVRPPAPSPAAPRPR